MPLPITLTLIGLSIALAILVGFRKGISQTPLGKVLAFAALAILPVVAAWGAFEEHMDRATSTQFCLSCHVMSQFGQTLHYDDKSYIPAVHYNNNFVPRDHACYTCHTDYGMFGTEKAKINGLHHIFVQYFGTVPKPEDIKLYKPFPNATCLHCHLGARKFEEVNGHHKTADMLDKVKSGQLSCVSSGCHDTVHEVGDLKGAKFWPALNEAEQK